MRWRHSLGASAFVVLAGGVLVACGSGRAPTSDHASSPAERCPGGHVKVTAELGTAPKAVCIRTGTQLDVILGPPGGGGLLWAQPLSSDTTLVRPLSAAPDPGGGWTASFLAVRAGHGRITASTSAPCVTAQPACRVASFLWDLPVTVTTG